MKEKKLTDDEIRLFVQILKLAKAYDDSCPDVGMPYSLETLLEEQEMAVGFKGTQEDRSYILERVEHRWLH